MSTPAVPRGGINEVRWAEKGMSERTLDVIAAVLGVATELRAGEVG